MIRTLITVWFMVAICFAQTAHADDNCRTEAQVRSDLSKAFPNAIVSTIADADVPAFLKGFNAEPPASDAHADRVVIISLDGNPIIYVVFFERGCLSGQGTLLRRMLDDIMSGA